MYVYTNNYVGDITYDTCQGYSRRSIIYEDDSKLVRIILWSKGCAKKDKTGL